MVAQVMLWTRQGEFGANKKDAAGVMCARGQQNRWRGVLCRPHGQRDCLGLFEWHLRSRRGFAPGTHLIPATHRSYYCCVRSAFRVSHLGKLSPACTREPQRQWSAIFCVTIQAKRFTSRIIQYYFQVGCPRKCGCSLCKG